MPGGIGTPESLAGPCRSGIALYGFGTQIAVSGVVEGACARRMTKFARNPRFPCQSATIGCGVPAGTTTPNHGVTWASPKPCSAMVGASGKYFERPSLIAAITLIEPVCTCASTWLADRKVEVIRPLAMSGTICG